MNMRTAGSVTKSGRWQVTVPLLLSILLGGPASIEGFLPFLVVAPLRGQELESLDASDPMLGDESSRSLLDPGTAAAGSTRTSSDGEQRTILQSLWESGFVGLLIFLLSMIAVGFIVEHALTIRKGVIMPDEVVEALDTLLEEGRLEEALEICHDPRSQSLFSHVVLAGLERFQRSEFGFAEYRAAVEEAGEDQTARLYRKTEVLGVIGAIAPMLGLLGTVIGMIKAFNVIASTGGMARPDQLAGGISQALVTTLMGLIVAIPAMVAFSFFRNKIDSLVAEAGSRVEQIMAPLGRRK